MTYDPHDPLNETHHLDKKPFMLWQVWLILIALASLLIMLAFLFH